MLISFFKDNGCVDVASSFPVTGMSIPIQRGFILKLHDFIISTPFHILPIIIHLGMYFNYEIHYISDKDFELIHMLYIHKFGRYQAN